MVYLFCLICLKCARFGHHYLSLMRLTNLMFNRTDIVVIWGFSPWRIERKRTSIISFFLLIIIISVCVCVCFILESFVKTRVDKLIITCLISFFFSFSFPSQIRHRFGLYDEISISNGFRVRHCNWIRFLRVSKTYGPQVHFSFKHFFVPFVAFAFEQSIDWQWNKAEKKIKSEKF